jgi:dephospho-CoA kinase
MKLIGLTGGIGMGKSTAAQLLAAQGVPVLDTDALARELVAPGQLALEEIRAAFGDGFVAADGSLRRGELAQLVFADATARTKLEAILHPRIRARWQAEAVAWRAAGKTGVVIIPLLFETAAAAAFDRILCVACTETTQAERLRARGWMPGEIAARNAAQWPVVKKMELAHCVLWSEGTEAMLAQQLAVAWR